MSIRNMHYDFKTKFNKLDSQKSRNLLVPEIDWQLNEAMLMYIKMIVMPRNNMIQGFESNQRTIDDIHTLVEKEIEINAVQIVENSKYKFALPTNYLHYVSSRILCTKGQCTKLIRNTVRQHDDRVDESMFAQSSFEWMEINSTFGKDGIYVETDGSFLTNKLYLDYIKKPLYMHAAADYSSGTYNLPDGTVLTGYQNCELPEHVHSDIVDLAVLITIGNITGDYQMKQSKVQITN